MSEESNAINELDQAVRAFNEDVCLAITNLNEAVSEIGSELYRVGVCIEQVTRR